MINPPLQHVPKCFPIQSLSKEFTVRLREMIMARPGYQLVSFDYSQLELRLLAYLSKDEQLKSCLTTNQDFFISLAANLLKKSEQEITREQRQNAKQVIVLLLFVFFMEIFLRFAMEFSMVCRKKHLLVKLE